MHITKSYFNGNQIRLNLHSDNAAEIESWVNFFYNIGAYNVPMAEQNIETPVTEINMPRERLMTSLQSYHEGKLLEARREANGVLKLRNIPIEIVEQAEGIVHDFLNNMPDEVCGYRQPIGMSENGSMPKSEIPQNFSCYRSAPVEE
jgi:hypothetical protein